MLSLGVLAGVDALMHRTYHLGLGLDMLTHRGGRPRHDPEGQAPASRVADPGQGGRGAHVPSLSLFVEILNTRIEHHLGVLGVAFCLHRGAVHAESLEVGRDQFWLAQAVTIVQIPTVGETPPPPPGTTTLSPGLGDVSSARSSAALSSVACWILRVAVAAACSCHTVRDAAVTGPSAVAHSSRQTHYMSWTSARVARATTRSVTLHSRGRPSHIAPHPCLSVGGVYPDLFDIKGHGVLRGPRRGLRGGACKGPARARSPALARNWP